MNKDIVAKRGSLRRTASVLTPFVVQVLGALFSVKPGEFLAFQREPEGYHAAVCPLPMVEGPFGTSGGGASPAL